MIHGSSTDPVNIKKISLKVWKLRSEVESLIKKQIESGEEDDLTKLSQEYSADDFENDENETSEQSEDDKLTIIQRRPDLTRDEIIRAKTVLSEINIDKMFFFSASHFIQGESIVIEFLIPKNFVLNATILYCRPYNMKSRIISNDKMPFRVGIQFTFLKPGEKTLLRNFLESIEAEKSQEQAPDQSAPEAEELDELED